MEIHKYGIRKYLLILYWFTIYSNSLPQSISYNIKGEVKDKVSGEALVYVNVLIKETTIGATTNERGYFVIVDAPADTLKLIVSYIGYVTQEISFDNRKGNSKHLHIELTPKVIESEEVVVKAENYKMWKTTDEVSQITISPKEIAYLPRIGEVDIFRSLQLMPGISGVNDGSAGLYIRGGTPDQNLVLLDGMTVYHVDHFFGFFSAFNADAIKDIQVYKGGFPASFGGRLSSVIDLTGKTGNINNFNLSLGANLLSVNGIMEIPFLSKGSILISARRSFADIIESPTYNSIFTMFNSSEEQQQPQIGGRGGFANFQQETVLPSFYFYDLNAKISYQLTEKDFASVSFYSGDDYLDQSPDPQQFTASNFFGENAGENLTREATEITEWGNIGSSIRWSRQWNDVFFSNLTAAYSEYTSNNTSSQNFASNIQSDSGNAVSNFFKTVQDNQIKDFTFRLDNEWNITQSHKIGLGTWISSIETDYKHLTNDSLFIVDRNNKGFTSAFYLQDKWKILEDLDLTAGLRSTYFNLTDSYHWEPRASFNYNIFDNFKLKGAWGENYQFINQITSENVLDGSRDFWILSDETLEPGFSENYILGLEYETNDYLFSVEGYYKNFENLVEFTQRIRRDPRNAGNDINNYLINFYGGTGYAKGIEFLLQKKFGPFNGWVSYTLGKVEYTFPAFDNGDPFPAKQDRTHEFKIVGNFTTGRWVFSSSWLFATGQPYTSPESQYYITLLNGETQSYIHVSEKNAYRLPDYHRLDLSVAYKFENKSFNGELGASVFNLYGRKNIWYKKYDLNVSPVLITDVAMLGFTPTVFVKLNF